ncbi:MAG: P1 family peptidase [Acidobacteriota bacterium]
MKRLLIVITILLLSTSLLAQSKPRARALGVPFDGTPGQNNSITDVKGVEVGYSTIIAGDGQLVVGKGPVRTGVTAILPRGQDSRMKSVFAGWYSHNGNGEMTGTAWLEEGGFLEGPVMITNTHSVGVVRDAVVAWRVQNGTADPTGYYWSLPVVAETWDGVLNDINGFHVKPSHVVEALRNAKPGAIAEGNIGGGTGMICYGFKGGTGTSSRRLTEKAGGYTLGVLVQANHGAKRQLTIAGVPVGRELLEGQQTSNGHWREQQDLGSIIIVVATDAPLLPHQLKRLARRATMGLARTGATSGNGSGDIFLAFSVANPDAAKEEGVAQLQMLPNDQLSAIFEATVQATEEAIVNALVAAETMTGINGTKITALPHDRLQQVLRKYNRFEKPN